MACHARFQKLTNRTATYQTELRADGLHIREQRDAPRLSSKLISNHTMLVAIRLLSLLSDAPIPVRAMYSRRARMPARERALHEETLGAAVTPGAALAEHVADLLGVPLKPLHRSGIHEGVHTYFMSRSPGAQRNGGQGRAPLSRSLPRIPLTR